MKKIICFIAIAVCAVSQASAQASKLSPVADTNVNATTQYLTTPLMNGNNGNNVFQYVGTKISGTVAGKVFIQGSLDGVNYTAMPSDTLTLADIATNTKVWDLKDLKRQYYRLNITTTGTVSLQNRGYYLNRKID